MPDIDLDFANKEDALALIKHVKASMIRDGERTKHVSGIYIQPVPSDYNNIATIDYEEAERRGYFKIDFLNNSSYQGITSIQHRDKLIEKEPDWAMLQYRDIVETLPHINEHFEIVNKLKPRSLEQLAAVLAIIRPAKRYLLNKPWDAIMKEVWVKSEGEAYFFKKSHSYSYALMIMMRMNLLAEQA